MSRFFSSPASCSASFFSSAWRFAIRSASDKPSVGATIFFLASTALPSTLAGGGGGGGGGLGASGGGAAGLGGVLSQPMDIANATSNADVAAHLISPRMAASRAGSIDTPFAPAQPRRARASVTDFARNAALRRQGARGRREARGSRGARGGSRRELRALGRQGRAERQQGRDLRGARTSAERRRDQVPARAHPAREPPDRAQDARRSDRGDPARRRQQAAAGGGARAAAEAAALAARQAADASRQARAVRQEGG